VAVKDRCPDCPISPSFRIFFLYCWTSSHLE